MFPFCWVVCQEVPRSHGGLWGPVSKALVSERDRPGLALCGCEGSLMSSEFSVPKRQALTLSLQCCWDNSMIGQCENGPACGW